MAEYIEREALREILDGWRDAHADVDDVYGCGLLEDVICEVDAQTAADVAPVVRCVNCKHLVAVNVNGKGIPTCRVSGMEVAPDEFCSRGEKERRC